MSGKRFCGLHAFVALLLSVSPSLAGLYSPDEPMPFLVRADGSATELPVGAGFNGRFPLLLLTRQNELDSNPSRAETNTDRKEVLKRIATRRAKATNALPPSEAAALAADYLRIGKPDDALNLLVPLSRSRSPDFRVLANLAHVYAVRGEWNEAVNYQDLLRDYDELPSDLAGTTSEQRKWLRRVERQFYMKWLQVHLQRTRAKAAPETEEVIPLFDVKFVNDAGQYEPGKLGAAERAKLPADAIAIVQQLILWAPWDISLQWLLAELYAADGRLREADALFGRWGNSGAYSNRPLFMAHRAAVRDAAAKLPIPQTTDDLVTPADPPPSPPEDQFRFLPSRTAVMVGGALFGIFALVLIALQVRALVRRLRR